MSSSAHIVTVTADNFHSVVIEGSQQRPVLVDFWANWCAPCRQLMPLLSRLAEDFAGAFLLAKVDTEAEQALAAQFGIRSLPTVQLFKNGQVVDQFMGALPESEIRAFLGRHIESESDRALAEASARISAGDLDGARALLDAVRSAEPENSRLFVAEVRLKMATGDLAGAQALLDQTPLELAADSELEALRGKLEFAAVVAEAPPMSVCAERVAADPGDSESRYRLAAHQVMAEDYEAALASLLELMRRDRGYGEDAGRRGILAVFGLLGNAGELVGRYRGLMARLLY